VTSTLARQPAAAGPQRSPARWDRRWWIGALFALLVWSVWTAGLDPSELINGRGWRQVRAFFAAMFQPDLSGGLLRLAVRESAVTVGYAVLGSALATAIGLVGGVLLTERIWMPQHGEMSAGGRFGWILTRLTLTVPRSMHEVVFGLVLVNVLGLNPLVAILAIGIPFGAITARAARRRGDRYRDEASRHRFRTADVVPGRHDAKCSRRPGVVRLLSLRVCAEVGCRAGNHRGRWARIPVGTVVPVVAIRRDVDDALGAHHPVWVGRSLVIFGASSWNHSHRGDKRNTSRRRSAAASRWRSRGSSCSLQCPGVPCRHPIGLGLARH